MNIGVIWVPGRHVTHLIIGNGDRAVCGIVPKARAHHWWAATGPIGLVCGNCARTDAAKNDPWWPLLFRRAA